VLRSVASFSEFSEGVTAAVGYRARAERFADDNLHRSSYTDNTMDIDAMVRAQTAWHAAMTEDAATERRHASRRDVANIDDMLQRCQQQAYVALTAAGAAAKAPETRMMAIAISEAQVRWQVGPKMWSRYRNWVNTRGVADSGRSWRRNGHQLSELEGEIRERS
jgi:hypothetical protein